MPTLNDFITEIITGEYGLDIVNYGKDSNGDFQPFEVDVDGKQYVIDEATATKLDTLIAKDFATEATLDTRLSSLESKIDALNTNIDDSQDADNNFNVSQNGSIVSTIVIDGDTIATSTSKNYYVDFITEFGTGLKNPIITIRDKNENGGQAKVSVVNYNPDYDNVTIINQNTTVLEGQKLTSNQYPIVYTHQDYVKGLRILVEETVGTNDISAIQIIVEGVIGGANV